MIFFPHQTWLYICHVEKKLYHFWLLYYVHMMRNLSETLHYTIIMLIKKCIHYFTTLSLKKHFFRCMSVFFLIRLYAALAFLPMLNGKINSRRKDFFFFENFAIPVGLEPTRIRTILLWSQRRSNLATAANILIHVIWGRSWLHSSKNSFQSYVVI